ncbi:MAG: tetratricopeptide repeat protein [Myxococcales bacterium]|nr:tetratricopeptide repeat protein [Myxococcales bacterium]
MYEQLGQPEKALASYRRAVAKAPWELETQRRYVALLEASGRSVEALAQLEAIGKIAPGEPQVALDLAERHMKRGDLKRALALVLAVEKRFAGDASILTSVADAYQRWGDAKRATAIYERIAAIDPDPMHLIALGEVYLNNGEASRAMATWEKIAASGSVTALLAAADVMAQNGGAKRALEFVARAEALEGRNYVVFRTKAMVLDALKLDVEALAAYKKSLDLIDPALVMERRDLRRRMISQLTRRTQSRALEMQAVTSWQAAFAATSPSLEAGYLLAMYYERRPADDEPIKTLTRLSGLAPADLYVLDDLAHAQVKARRHDEAVASLLTLAERDPTRQQEMYTRIAEIKSMARDDEAALTWALKAVEGNPRHVEGHKRLAERYVEMQRIEEATKSYEAAIALDPNAASAFDVYFALASLYLQTGNTARASELYREVLRRAVDEEQIAQAGRAAIEIGELTNTLGELEKTLAPLAFAMTHKPTYRQLLVGLYLRYIPVLATQATAAMPAVAARARAELARLAGSALTPLLDVLHDELQASAHGSAIAALEQLGNPAAARALIEFAKRTVPDASSLAGRTASDLRVAALLAAGRLRTPDAVRLVGELLRSSDGAMREAAWFTVATQDPAAPLGALTPALADRRTSIAVLGCVAIAASRDRRALEVAQRVAQDEAAHELVRAACIYAMSAQPAIPPTSLALLATLSGRVGEVGRLATWALSRHRARGANRLDLIAQYWGEHHDTAAAALMDALAGESPLAAWHLPRHSGRLDAAAIVASLGEARANVVATTAPIGDLADELIAAAVLELRAGDHYAKHLALQLLDQADQRLSFGRPSALEGALVTSVERLGAAIWPEVSRLGPPFSVSSVWASVATKTCPDKDLGPLLETLSNAPAASQAVALEVLRQRARIELSDPLIKTLTRLGASEDWRVRQLAATVGGRLVAPSPALVAACMRDQSAYVRASCVPPNGPNDAALHDAIASAARDSNPAVRAAASTWLCTHAPTSPACSPP